MKDIKQLSTQYVTCAKGLRTRIDELRGQLSSAKTETQVYNLNRRIKLLQNEYYDCIKIARYLERESVTTTLENGLWPATKEIYRPSKKPRYYS